MYASREHISVIPIINKHQACVNFFIICGTLGDVRHVEHIEYEIQNWGFLRKLLSKC